MHIGATMKSVRTTVSLPQNQYEQVQALADANGLSVAWIIRQAVGDFLGKVEKDQTYNPLHTKKREK